MKRILISVSVIAVAAAVVIGATTAFFSDTETSVGNTFTAGAIDLTIDSHATFNGQPVLDATWALKDLNPTSDKFFNFADIKPGDKGENTISLHVENNDAWACVNIIPTKNDDVSSTEPELAVDVPNTDSIYDGELAQNMTFKIWADICTPNSSYPNAHVGDNIYQSGCDKLLTEGHGPIVPTSFALATPAGNVFTGVVNDPIDGTQTNYLGVEWSLPFAVGNIVQTDNYQADVSFYVEQSRNNPNFVCPDVAPASHALRLENETIVQGGPWTVLSGDQIYADLTWLGDGNTFSYTLNGKGLALSTEYSLIYYADGWPGNNPGAFIGNGTTDSSGNLVMSGNPELNTDMPESPDGNLAVGAKIWLVRSSDYNSGSYSTGPMTAWNPANYLFEGNVYIHYNDTNH